LTNADIRPLGLAPKITYALVGASGAGQLMKRREFITLVGGAAVRRRGRWRRERSNLRGFGASES